jgi:threonine aldolase
MAGMILYMDGARLGYGLMARDNDLTLPDIANLCDVFYIGGTKVGALFGEAVVMTRQEIKKDFRYMLKRQGGMLAKGRLLGIQFQTLFEDGLYWRISEHAVNMAMKLKNAIKESGYAFYADVTTNQQLPIMPDTVLQQLSEKYSYSFWEKIDETHTAVRFCTSWATREEDVDALIQDIRACTARNL